MQAFPRSRGPAISRLISLKTSAAPAVTHSHRVSSFSTSSSSLSSSPSRRPLITTTRTAQKANPSSNTFITSRVSHARSKTYSTTVSTERKASMAPSKLVRWFPNLQTPAVINAPMLGSAGAAMATEVHKAGGFGFIAAGFDFSPSSAQLRDLDAALTQARSLLALTDDAATLPLGVGFITSHETADQFGANVLPVLVRHRVSAAWLFAPHPELRPHAHIVPVLRAAGIKVFVQVGNVAAAREAAADGADVLVAQGVDAGGHQFSRGCGVVALLPEISTMLATEFADREVAVAAAGGIVEGRGMAAALALGADGVVMGTRFVATPEAMSAQLHKDVIVATRDGGLSTWKSEFHDRLVDSKLWREGYDGRAIVGDIHREYHALGGATATVEESRERLRTGWSEEEGKRMLGKWAGAGVGLVSEIKPAGKVVVEVREAARKRVQEMAGLV